MGLTVSILLMHFLRKEDVRILMVGLDGAGKTSILYHMKMGKVVTTIPTIGYNVETMEYKNLRFTVWDVGGLHTIRILWHHEFIHKNTSAVIFVVDAANAVRIKEAAKELHAIMEVSELQNTVLLVLANKQDLPQTLSDNEIVQRLELNKIKQDWHLHGTCATRVKSLHDGLERLRELLSKRKRSTK